MTQTQWQIFSNFRNEFKRNCELWQNDFASILLPLQNDARKKDNVPDYPLETSIVYNTSLDEITQNSDIKLIVIGDNPGKDEQRAKNRRYLIGQSGKIAEGFFRKNPELGIDFRKNVIILNKTPIHTAKTKELDFLRAQNKSVNDLIIKTQLWMAEQTYYLQVAFGCQLWIVGYSEIKNKGVFVPWRKKLEELYLNDANYDNLFVFQHFSMNRFLIDLNMATASASASNNVSENMTISKTLQENLSYLGQLHKKEIFYN